MSFVRGVEEEMLLRINHSCLNEEAGRSGTKPISSFFELTLSVTPHEKAMFHSFDVMISLSLPVSFAKNPHFSGL